MNRLVSQRSSNLLHRFIGVTLGTLFIFCVWNESKRNTLAPSIRTKLYPTKLSSAVGNGSLQAELINNIPSEVEGSSAPFLPVRVLRKYQEQHYQTALLREYDADAPMKNRKFAVAYYWCPHRAGNILHSFFNSIVWSMIHNRTVLWKYHNTSNTETDCEAVLKRASWLPSYDEWRDRLQFQEDPVPVPNDASRWAQDQSHKIVIYPQIPDVLHDNSAITRHSWSDHPLYRDDYRAYIRALPDTFQNTTASLYSEGVEFLYGMLYCELFTLQLPATPQIVGVNHSQEGDDNTFSLALHSRHTVDADDGSYIPDEVKCLSKLLRFSNNLSCRVYIMSDRQKTIEMLTEWLLQRNCSVVTANHDTGKDEKKEHGPWAGVGFLQDLEITGKATHGMVGDTDRSSTRLLIDIVEYRRRMSVWQAGGDLQTISDLRTCRLPGKSISGYDYGPGTPTFRYHSYLQPLEPVKVLDEYKSRAREDTLGQERYVVVSFDYERPTPDSVYSVLNNLIYSILFNRTLIVRGDCPQGPCIDSRRILLHKNWVTTTRYISPTLLSQIRESKYTEIHVDDKMSLTPRESATPTASPISSLIYDEVLVAVHFSRSHYNLSDWNVLLQNSATNSMSILEQLFARGIEFLYGMLFHQVFSLPERFEPPWEYSPTMTAVLDLENVPQSVDNVEQCMASMFLMESNDDGDLISPADCHIFAITSSNFFTATSNLDALYMGEEEIAGSGTWRNCSISILPFYDAYQKDPSSNSSDFENNNIWWKNLDLISRARSGWIGPVYDSTEEGARRQTSSSQLLIIKEWIEYRRHLETWKLGREPFRISKLQECPY